MNEIINKISSYKFQLVINKSLFNDEVITRETYEAVESSLLKKINILTDKMEMSKSC